MKSVHGGPVAADGGGRDRPHRRSPLQPAFQQLGHGARPGCLVAAGADLLQQPGLDLLGLAQGGLGVAGDLLADVALAAGEGVAAGVELDLEAGASLADHGPPSCFIMSSDSRRMTRE